jgi:hypothetical protein
LLLVFFSALISLQALFVHRVVDVVEEGSPVGGGTAAHTKEEEGIADTMGGGHCGPYGGYYGGWLKVVPTPPQPGEEGAAQ